MFSESITHGFFPNAIDRGILLAIREKIYIYLAAKQYPTYVSNVDEIIPEVIDLLPESLYNKIKDLLLSNDIKLENIELHYLPPFSEPIPPHQDNFYHCIEGGQGLKILIPFGELSSENGGLFFLNCPSKIGVLQHSASSIKNFSSFILPNILDKLDYQKTSYCYQPGDASYHLLNSVHYSHGNRSQLETVFLVFRYQASWACESPELLKAYRNVYHKHLQNIDKINH